MDSTVVAYRFDRETGALTEMQTLSTLPEGFSGENTGADIHVHPSGHFLYGSNRRHDSIVIFRIDESSGRLTAVGHETDQGRNPRNFAVDPSGAYLLAANQSSDTVVSFRIDCWNRALKPTGSTVAVPCCVPQDEPDGVSGPALALDGRDLLPVKAEDVLHLPDIRGPEVVCSQSPRPRITVGSSGLDETIVERLATCLT